jgi:hypothetical protein
MNCFLFNADLLFKDPVKGPTSTSGSLTANLHVPPPRSPCRSINRNPYFAAKMVTESDAALALNSFSVRVLGSSRPLASFSTQICDRKY